MIVIIMLIINRVNDIFHNKLNIFQKEIKTSEILIVGTSHSLWSINPKKLGHKAINISEINKPIETDIEIINNNLDYFTNLKLVIIPLDYFTLFYDGKNEAYSKKYDYHWGLTNKIKSNRLNFYFGHFFTCGISIFADLLEGKVKTTSNFTPKYQDWSKLSLQEQSLKSKKRMNAWENNWIDTSINNVVTEKIIQTTLDLKNRGIHCLFITLPVSSNMKKLYKQDLVEINNRNINLIIKETNCKYVDYNNSIRFNDSLFRDQDHLNIKGANVISDLIKKEIDTVLINDKN